MTRVNVVIPAYNEEERLPATLQAYQDYFYRELGEKSEFKSDFELYLVIVDDGSTDNTADLGRKFLAETGIKGEVISYGDNQGKGFAVRTGMLESPAAEFYYLADSDLASPWSTLVDMLENYSNTKYDCVIGSRALPESVIVTSGHRMVGGRLSNLLINSILGLGLADTQCGYKLFRVNCLPAFEAQKLTRWGFDFEVLFLIKKKLGLRVAEAPLHWANRDGSKVRFIDYFRTLRELIKVRFGSYPTFE